MCKTAKQMAENPGTAQENVNTNIGLLNMSSEEIGGPMTTQSVVTYLIALICIVMVLKWLKKCYGRRQARKRELIRSLSQPTPVGNQNQMAMQQIPMQQIPSIPGPLPALAPPIIIHPNQFKIGLEGTGGENDRMEKYRN